MFRHILATTDGHPDAAPALTHADRLARQCGGALTVLHVVPRPALSGGPAEGAHLHDPAAARLGRLARGEAALRAARAALPDCDPTLALGTERAGGVARTVAEEVAARGADLVVVATHGRTGPAHLLLGSVAEAVVREVGVPVLLVRRAVRARAGAGAARDAAHPANRSPWVPDVHQT